MQFGYMDNAKTYHIPLTLCFFRRRTDIVPKILRLGIYWTKIEDSVAGFMCEENVGEKVTFVAASKQS